MRYRIGDKVVVVETTSDDRDMCHVSCGDVGEIIDIEDRWYVVSVGKSWRWYCDESQIELVDLSVKRTERGWAGHFICSRNCLFRRNTLLEYKDKKWIVSTVGSMINSQSKKVEAIGYNRWYETMCFDAIEQDGYIEANVGVMHYPSMLNTDKIEGWLCAETYEELCEKYPTPDNTANDMHEQWVDWAIEEIKKNDK